MARRIASFLKCVKRQKNNKIITYNKQRNLIITCLVFTSMKQIFRTSWRDRSHLIIDYNGNFIHPAKAELRAVVHPEFNKKFNSWVVNSTGRKLDCAGVYTATLQENIQQSKKPEDFTVFKLSKKNDKTFSDELKIHGWTKF